MKRGPSSKPDPRVRGRKPGLHLAEPVDVGEPLRQLRRSRPHQGMVGGRRTGVGGMVKAPRPIPETVRATQARASDPAASAFVSANAGSGKTYRAGAAGDPAVARRRAAGKNSLHHLHQGRRRQHGRAGIHDAGPLGDARRRRAGCRDPRSRHRTAYRETADVGAKIVRLRAGNARRPQGSDHSRAVHAAAAAIPVRGQRAGALRRARRARPERDDGARQSGGAAGGLPQSRQCHGPRAPDGDGQRR